MLSNPSSLASANASRVCSTVCARPIRFRVSSFMVCGLTEIRLTPASFKTRSFSRVMLSGRPASTVNSRSPAGVGFSISMSTFSSSAESAVGVPPPMYIVSSFFPAKACFVKSSSFFRHPRYSSALLCHFAIGLERNEQYAHLVGQNGIPM